MTVAIGRVGQRFSEDIDLIAYPKVGVANAGAGARREFRDGLAADLREDP